MPETVRIPVLGLLGDVLRDVFGNLGGLVRIAWPYYALAAASLVLGFAVTGQSLVAEAVATVLGPGTASILSGLAVLACTVKWQRHITLAEPLAGIAPLNGRVMRYGLWSLLLGLLCALPILGCFALSYALGLLGTNPTGEAPYRIGPAGILVCVAGGLIGILLIVRLCLVLPAISADDRQVTPKRSWDLTAGNALRLLAVILLITAGFAVLGAVVGLMQAALEAAASDGGQLVPALTGLVLQAGVNLVASMAAASMFAHAYLSLVSQDS